MSDKNGISVDGVALEIRAVDVSTGMVVIGTPHMPRADEIKRFNALVDGYLIRPDCYVDIPVVDTRAIVRIYGNRRKYIKRIDIDTRLWCDAPKAGEPVFVLYPVGT